MENIKKFTSLNTPARASVWYIASGALGRAVGALMTPIFTRLLTPQEYGLYPLYTSWIGVISVLVTLELTGSAIYRGFQKYSDNKDEFMSASLGLLGTVFVLFCAVYFAFYGFFFRLTGLEVRVSIFMFAEIFTSSVISLYLAKARFEYNYKAVSTVNMISALAAPLVALGLILLIGIKAESRIYAATVISVLCAIPIMILILKRSDKLYSFEIWRYLLHRSIPLLPHYFAVALILKAGEISIGRSHGTDALAQYSIAVSVGMILTIITSGLLSSLSPWIIRKVRDGSIEKVREFLLLLTKALLLCSLLILAAAPEILSFLAADGFRAALAAIYPLEIAVVFSFLSGAIMSGCAYYERGGLSSIPSFISAGVSILLSFLILPKVDFRFSGIFTLVSYVILALSTSMIFKRLSGKYPIDIKRSALYLVFTASYAALLLIFKDALISRIFLTLPILLLLLISAKDIYRKVREQ